jgi:hypothetical protein
MAQNGGVGRHILETRFSEKELAKEEKDEHMCWRAIRRLR